MNWNEKSKNSDLFFCTTVECNVITFRPGPLENNICPKCKHTGSLVRSRSLLPLGIRST